MSLTSESVEIAAPLRAGHAEPSMAGVGDYLALMKPRVMSLVVFTALVGLMIAPVHVHPVLAFTAILCIAVGAGASGALVFFYGVIDAFVRKQKAADNPWGAGATTLEWTLPSPPPFHQFNELPLIK